ncbi:MAG: transcriptional regulator [Lentisphaerae bacterium RIFOXYA12_FULL_48_11]|nr:MAG: transcriptional regulator [Lentisphaerae bacterium RIFOXYA12_FULL_48_11]
MAMEINRFEVFLVTLDPTVGHEIKKTRPCVVISPDEMNHHIGTIIVAPMTTKGRNYPTRIDCTFQGVEGQVVLDQIRTVDKARLVKKLGQLSQTSGDRILDILTEMFQK